ncbi:MAG: argininosuccinate synthase [Planctomycetota bacterium]|nr:argininosuccinate synthase [Planctomycetota bacterium]
MAVAALAFSGGLDTSYAVLALREQGFDVVTVTVDTGGFDAAELSAIEARSLSLGAKKHVTLDGRQDVYDRFFSYLIRGNVLRGGVYPVAVGAERQVQAEGLARAARDHGCAAVAHGCTAAGNDQVRFDVALQTLAPDLELLAPVRDGQVERATSTQKLAAAGVAIPPKQTRYSINAGLVGTTVGGGATHDPWEAIPEEAYVEAGSLVTESATARTVIVGFERGLPVALDGEAMEPLELIAQLDSWARPLGIGRGVHLGDTILGIKGRIGFVAPAATVLIGAHRELEKLVLTKRQLQVKGDAGSLYGDLLHEGLWLDPVCRDLERLLESSQERATGDARVELARERFAVTGVRSPHALVRPGARYGEASALWDGRDAAGFARVYGMSARLARRDS